MLHLMRCKMAVASSGITDIWRKKSYQRLSQVLSNSERANCLTWDVFFAWDTFISSVEVNPLSPSDAFDARLFDGKSHADANFIWKIRCWASRPADKGYRTPCGKNGWYFMCFFVCIYICIRGRNVQRVTSRHGHAWTLILAPSLSRRPFSHAHSCVSELLMRRFRSSPKTLQSGPKTLEKVLHGEVKRKSQFCCSIFMYFCYWR